MNEYQDQDVWFELWGFDGLRWEFITHFDTRPDAESYERMLESDYEQHRIKRVFGLA